jgi:hypothetical protein
VSVSLEHLLPYEVVLLRREPDGPPDVYGNPTFSELEQPTRCELQQSGARMDLERGVQVTTWHLFLPADAPASGWDAVRLADGRVLELNGEAWPVGVPRAGGRVHHVEAYLSEVL